MVRSKDEVLKIANDYVNFVKKVFFVKKAYLFGSYAKNSQKEWSDIDLAIISPDFSDIPRLRAMKILTKMSRDFDSSIEPIAFNDENLSNPVTGTLLHEVISHGIEIF